MLQISRRVSPVCVPVCARVHRQARRQMRRDARLRCLLRRRAGLFYVSGIYNGNFPFPLEKEGRRARNLCTCPRSWFTRTIEDIEASRASTQFFISLNFDRKPVELMLARAATFQEISIE